MNQSLLEQLNEVELRIVKLTEQTDFFRRLCRDLADSKKKLEAENQLLRQTVEEQNAFIQDLETHLQKAQQQPALPSKERKALLGQIDAHIQQLDSMIDWLER